MPFKSLGLSAEIASALADIGYHKATPIQRQAIPIILSGKDLMAGAQTGTGKTAAFTLPLLERLSKNQHTGKHHIRALILTPTRELATQVFNNVCSYSRHLSLKTNVIYGGVSIHHQIRKLNQGADIIVATPGRLLDHAKQQTIDLSRVEILVLDEADRMLDMGFIHDIRRITSLLPHRRQNLLFFATFSDEIKNLAHTLLKSPILLEVARRNIASEKIKQMIHPIDSAKKRELLSFLIGSKNWRQVLVFTRTKHGANRLTKKLESDGLSAMAIHGDKKQSARNRALEQFKKGLVRVLVATDVASRGLDIDQLPHVVNFELPHSPEDYVHRIGRTGRAGQEGEAVSLVSIDELDLLKNIEKLIKSSIPQIIVPGYEPNPSVQTKMMCKKHLTHAKPAHNPDNRQRKTNLETERGDEYKRKSQSKKHRYRNKNSSQHFDQSRKNRGRRNRAKT